VSAASLKSREDDNSDDNVSSMNAESSGSFRSEDSDHSFEENGELN